MKKIVFGLMVALGAVFAATATASAAEASSRPSTDAYFDGVFEGTIYGDKGSSAPIVLELSQDGRQVEGYVEFGRGLYVNGGVCGSGYIPGGAQYADGLVSRSNPRQLNAGAALSVSGVKVNIDLKGLASADGEEIDAQAKIDLPWLCGRDPVLSGTLYRAQ